MRKEAGSLGQGARRACALVLVSMAMALLGAQASTKVTPQATPSATAATPALIVPAPAATAPGSQAAGSQAAGPKAAGPKAAGSQAAGPESLPKGFSDIALGMSRDDVIAKLMANPLFAWRGPEDVSLLSSPNQSLIEVAGQSFIRRAFFQFLDG
ncbi:MAG: hypothetical protein WCQ50_19845, partial [Spirochaetota bacterium]